MLIKVTIPIHNYCCDGVDYQDIYFNSDHSPTKDEVLNYLRQLSVRDSQYPEYTGDWEDAIQSVDRAEDWPRIGAGVISRNTFVNRDDLRKFQANLPLSINVIEVKNL